MAVSLVPTSHYCGPANPLLLNASTTSGNLSTLPCATTVGLPHFFRSARIGDVLGRRTRFATRYRSERVTASTRADISGIETLRPWTWT